MSEDNYFHGKITIAPPLTWGEVSGEDSSWAEIRAGLRAVMLRMVEIQEHTQTGVIITRTFDAIMPTRPYMNGPTVEEDIQTIVDTYPGRQYDGWIQRQWLGGEFDMVRLYVKDGRVVTVKARLEWPEP